MRYLGRWCKRTADRLHYPDPRELVGDYAPGVRRIVADYLAAGEVQREYRCYEHCASCGECLRGLCETSDGHWIWTGGLAHYVAEHSVLLPPEFIETVVSGRSPLPPLKDDDWFAFWRAWADQQSSRSERVNIAVWLLRENRERRNAADQYARDLTEKLGESGNKCRWSGCESRALVGRLLRTVCNQGVPEPIRVPELEIQCIEN